jgi:hypothetical protein
MSHKASYGLITCALILVLMTRLNIVSGLSDTQNTMIFPIDSKPYGLTYSEWAAKWWQWALSIPQDRNPINDQTGKNCSVAQQGQVWFLAGTSGGRAERSCTIPQGKAIFLNILTGECNFKENPDIKTAAGLLPCAIALNNGGLVSVSIDGTQVQNLEKYRVQSPPFNATFSSKPIYPVTPGPTVVAADGWYLMIKPLSPGKHTIVSKGSVIEESPTTGSSSFANEVIYNVIVN